MAEFDKNDLFGEDFMKSIEDVKKGMQELLVTFRELGKEAKEIQKAFKGAKSFNEVQKAAGDAAKNVDKLTAEEKELVRLEKQLETQTAKAATARTKKGRALQKEIEFNRKIQNEERKLARQLANGAISAKQYEKALTRLTKTKTKGAKSTNTWGKALGSFAFKFNALGNIAANVFARITSGIANYIRGAVEMAAKAEGIERAFRKINQPGLLDELRQAVRGTVNDVDLMAAAVRANNFQIPLKNLAKFFEFAADRANDTGEEVDYLVDSIVNGISRKSLPILDNLGLSTMQIREEMGKTGDMAQAVANIIDQEMGGANDKLLTTSQLYAQSKANAENLKRQVGEIGNLFINKVNPAAQKFVKFLREALMTKAMIQRQVLDANIIYNIELDRAEVAQVAAGYEKHRLDLLEGQTYEQKAAFDILGQYRKLLASTNESEKDKIEQITAQIKALEVLAGLQPESGSVLDSTSSLNTIAGIGEQIKDLTALRDKAHGKELAQLNIEIQKLQEKQNALRMLGIETAEPEEQGEIDLTTSIYSDQMVSALIKREEDTIGMYDAIDQRAKESADTQEEIDQRKLQSASMAIDAISNIAGAYYDLQEAKMQAEIDRAGDNAEAKAAIEKKYANKRKENMKSQTLINIAAGIARAFVDYQWPYALIPAAAVGIEGGIQLAAIEAQHFDKGTKSSPEGWHFTGEKGSELMVDKRGNVGLSPSTETLTYLEKGTQILPADITEQFLKYSYVKTAMPGQDERLVEAVINRLDKSNDRLAKEIRSKPVASSTLTPGGILTATHRGNTTIKKLDRYFK